MLPPPASMWTRLVNSADRDWSGNLVMCNSCKMTENVKIGFIGGGNMCQAIAMGFIKSGLVKPKDITASALTEKTLNIWKVSKKYSDETYRRALTSSIQTTHLSL